MVHFNLRLDPFRDFFIDAPHNCRQLWQQRISRHHRKLVVLKQEEVVFSDIAICLRLSATLSAHAVKCTEALLSLKKEAFLLNLKW